MRIAFFGIYALGSLALRRLSEDGLDIGAVVTKPDGETGPQVVAAEARALGLPVLQAEMPGDPASLEFITASSPDLIVVSGYHLRLPRSVLALSRRGAVNTHLSMLPRYRGPVPHKWAIIHGERSTGVTIHELTERFDAGPIIAQRAAPILGHDTADSLFARLSVLAAELLVEVIHDRALGRAQGVPQDERLATYQPNLTDADTAIDWDTEPAAIERLVRALTLRPGGWFVLDGERVRVREVDVLGERSDRPPGTIVERDGEVMVITTAGADVRVRLAPPARS